MGKKLATLSGSAEPEALMDVNTTPLIDVMLVLLVMLILTIPTQLHTAGLFIGQGGPKVPAPDPTVHVVSIDFDGTVYWDTQPLAGRAAVDAKMQEIGTLALAAQPEVHIKANKLVDYGAVAAVLTSAQNHSVKRIAMVGIGQSAS
jgi:biopolymer transport protein ExbD